MKNVQQALLIGIAGSCGAASRMIICEIAHGSIAATFLVNMAGTFIFCFIIEYARKTKCLNETAVAVLTTGFLGAFTTFSAVSFETMELIESGYLQLAMIYVAASIIGGLLMAALGMSLAGRLLR